MLTDKEMELVVKLGQQVTTIGTDVWSIYRSQAKVSAVIDCLQYSLLAGFWTTLSFKWKKIMELVEDNEGLAVISFFGGVFMVVITAIAFFAVYDTITALVNPDYWALNKLISKLKG
jgi:hypothetical protein